MKFITLCIAAFVFIALSCSPADARGFRGGGSRFSSRYSSRYSYSSSRYSYRSRYRVRVSAYRYRSLRSYRRYSRYSRSSYRYNAYGSYRTSVSAIGMGGITVNKQSLLLAGSVYVAYNMRPNLYTTSGVIIRHAVDEYAICSGLVRWSPVYKNGTYVESESDISNSSTTTITATTASTTTNQVGNGTTAYQPGTTVAPLVSSGDVTYRYFLCPNDLMDGDLDDYDAFCCGPPGNQMCCDEEDFWEQDVNRGSTNTTIVITAVTLFILAAVLGPLYFFRKRLSAVLRCLRRCPRSSSARPPPRPTTPSVIFQPVRTSEPPGDHDGSVKLPASTAGPQYGLYPQLPPAEVNNGSGRDLPSHPPPPYPGPFS